MPKRNLTAEEAELKKLEEINRRKAKLLDEQAELNRKEKELTPEEDAAPPADLENSASVFEDEKIVEIMRDHGAGKFTVLHMERGQEMKVGQFPLSDWPDRMDVIAHDCNGGTFKIVFRDARGQYLTQRTETFDPRFYGKKEEARAVAQGPDMGAFASMFEQSRRDMMDMMKLMIQSQQGGGMFKTAQDVASIASLFKEQGGGTAAVMEALQAGIELGKSVNGGSEPESVLHKVIDTVGKPLGDVLSRLLVPQVPAPPPGAPRPALTTAKPKQEPNPKEEVSLMTESPALPPEVQMVKDSLGFKFYAPSILKAAMTGEDPKTWADNILSRLPEAYHAIALDVASRPDYLEYLALYDARVKDYAPWFLALSDGIKAQFAPETEETETEAKIPATVNGVE